MIKKPRSYKAIMENMKQDVDLSLEMAVQSERQAEESKRQAEESKRQAEESKRQAEESHATAKKAIEKAESAQALYEELLEALEYVHDAPTLLETLRNFFEIYAEHLRYGDDVSDDSIAVKKLNDLWKLYKKDIL